MIKIQDTMNKLLTIAYGWGVLLLSSCMDASVVGVDMSGMQTPGIARFDGTIYEYLQNDDSYLGVTYDSLLYLLDYADESENSTPLKFSELKECLQDKMGQYTFIAIPDSCFRCALKALNQYRKLNKLTIDGESLKDAEESEKYASGELSLEKLLYYRKNIPRYDDKKPEVMVKTDIYEYKAPLDSMLCRYMASGIYDTEMLATISSDEGKIIQGLYTYRMNLTYRRLPASGFVGSGPKDIIFYDMCNTLEKNRWEPAKVLWADIYAKNGVIHVLVPQHEFGYGQFIHYFRNLGHEE